jgi:DNA invertase Pin-like site-specific DNA recombinase
MRAAIYVRVSTDEQGASVDAQEADARRFAESRGWKVVAEYVDEGVSGAAPLEERPGLRRLLRELGPGDVVVAFALDRLSRSDDEIDRAAIYGAIRRAGARIETVEDGAVDRSTFAGRIVDTVRQEVAAEERRKIISRTAAGKRAALAAGHKPQGATPYGLRWSREGGWGIDEERATVVRAAFAAIVSGRSCAAVASTLPGPAPRGASWGARGVWQLVTRRTYLGEWAFGGAVVRVPAIVDAATWHAAQAALEVSGRRGLRRTRHVYLCDDGVGVCGYCGGALRVRWGGRRSQVSYYFCADKICTGGWRRTEVVDREVWERVVAALLREDLVGRAAAEESEAGADAAAAERQAGSFAAQLEKLAAHERSVLALHRRELVSEAAMGWEMEEIRRRRRMLEKSAADAEREASQARAGMAALVEVQRAARALAGELAQLEGAERREAVRGLRTAVRLRRDDLEVRFSLSCAVGGCSSACTTAESATPEMTEISVVA